MVPNCPLACNICHKGVYDKFGKTEVNFFDKKQARRKNYTSSLLNRFSVEKKAYNQWTNNNA